MVVVVMWRRVFGSGWDILVVFDLGRVDLVGRLMVVLEERLLLVALLRKFGPAQVISDLQLADEEAVTWHIPIVLASVLPRAGVILPR